MGLSGRLSEERISGRRNLRIQGAVVSRISLADVRRERASRAVRIRLRLRSRTVVFARQRISWLWIDDVGVSLKFEVIVLAVVISECEVLLPWYTLHGRAARPAAYQFRSNQTRSAGVGWVLNFLVLRDLVQEAMEPADILAQASKDEKRSILGPVWGGRPGAIQF